MSSRHPRQQHGFTLIELLVSMLTSLVVAGALFAILEISLHQTSRITDRVQATQLGRTAMTKVIDELRSACLAREFAPVREQSSTNVLRFASGFSEKAVIEPSEAFEHEIVWSGVYPGAGTLVDKAYNAKSASAWPKFEYEVTASPVNGVRVAENIYAQARESKEVPIFQYYKYSTKASLGGTEAPTSTLTQIPLKAKETLGASAKSVAAVQVSFSQAPSDNNLALSRAAEFSNLVTFAFASPNSEATITDGPCQ
jgi:Tfp pilus assembly protein PilW